MTRGANPGPADEIAALVDSASAVWDAYLAVGPDRVDAALYDPVAASVTALEACLGRLREDTVDDDHAEILAAAATLRDLSERCACTSLGLCFISGEAGLIPRRDQHEAMEAALERMRTARRVLESGQIADGVQRRRTTP